MSTRAVPKASLIKNAFLVLFTSLFIALNIMVGIYLVDWRRLVCLFQFLILQIVNIGVAYGLAELALALFVKQEKLPSVQRLLHQPSVAVLYVTCDDVMPKVLEQLRHQTYANYDVYVLDDSSLPERRALVDSSGFSVVRRVSREGFKAGNLNNWLCLHGAKYEYFVVVDSDSLLPPRFVEQMLRYAEHPANRDVAIFQSKIKVWNLDNRFVRIVSSWSPMWLFPIAKLGNLCDTVLSWGHNCLYRTDLVSLVGGFDERFTAEDYATGVNLMRAGFKCRLVDLVSYEAIPTSPRSYKQRATRWAKQTLQLFQLDTTGLPTTTKLHIVANAWSFAVWILYIPAMVLVTWGSRSTYRDFIELVQLLTSGRFIHTPLLVPVLIIAFYNTYFLLLRYPLCLKLGIASREYWETLVVLLALGPYMAIPLSVGQVKTLVTKRPPEFVVTGQIRDPASDSIWRSILDMWHLFLLIAIVLTGVIRNPVCLIYNSAWLLPLVISPVVLLLVSWNPANQDPESSSAIGVYLGDARSSIEGAEYLRNVQL